MSTLELDPVGTLIARLAKARAVNPASLKCKLITTSLYGKGLSAADIELELDQLTSIRDHAQQ
jgi:hypothetical protein